MKWLDDEGPVEAGVFSSFVLAVASTAPLFVRSLDVLQVPALEAALVLCLALLALALRHALHRRFTMAFLTAFVGVLGFGAVLVIFVVVGARGALASH